MGRASALLVVCSTLCRGGQPQQLSPAAQEFIEGHFTAAKQAEALENFPKAVEEYEAILKKYPIAVPEVYQNLGLVYYLQHRYEQAIPVFERGLRLKPAMAGSHLFLGASYVGTDRPDKAVPYLESAHKAQPTVESATWLGLALTSLKRYGEANEFFRFALQLAPNKDYYLHMLGNGYLKLSEQISNRLSQQRPDSKYERLMMAKVVASQGWYQVAAKEYLETAKRDPMNASLFIPLARWLAALGLEKASEMALERYRELMPNERAARLERVDLPRRELADIGISIDYEAELRALPPVTAQNRDPLPFVASEVNEEMRKSLAAASEKKWREVLDFIMNSRWVDAARTLELIRSAPREWLRDYLLASVWLLQDETAKAEQAARDLKGFSDDIPAVALLRWDIYRQISLEYFQKLLDDYPQSALAHYVKGRTLDAQGKREALDEYKAAVAADPALPEVRIAIADYYLSHSNVEAALAECQKELEINPGSNAAKVRIGQIYVELQKADEGIRYIREALKADPEDANARTDLARGLEQKGEVAAAISEIQRALTSDPSLNRLHYVLARLYRKTGKPELAKREFELFQKNETSARRQHQERVRKLRELETQKP